MSPPSAVRLLMIGAGGHARVCLDVVAEMPGFDAVGAVSSDGSGVDGLGVAVLGRPDQLADITRRVRATTFCIAIGDNLRREVISTEITESGWSTTTIRSASAVVSPSVELGDGCQLLPGSIVNAASILGRGTIVNTNASVDHDAHIGDFVHIAPGSVLGGNVTVGDRAFVGLGSRVLPGRTIGADAIVGAGAVVVDDVPAGATVVGIPARVRS